MSSSIHKGTSVSSGICSCYRLVWMFLSFIFWFGKGLTVLNFPLSSVCLQWCILKTICINYKMTYHFIRFMIYLVWNLGKRNDTSFSFWCKFYQSIWLRVTMIEDAHAKCFKYNSFIVYKVVWKIHKRTNNLVFLMFSLHNSPKSR